MFRVFIVITWGVFDEVASRYLVAELRCGSLRAASGASSGTSFEEALIFRLRCILALEQTSQKRFSESASSGERLTVLLQASPKAQGL